MFTAKDRGKVRRNPARLSTRTSIATAHGNNTVILVIWILWVLLPLRLLWKVFDWLTNYFVITSQRLLLTQGFLTRKVEMIPPAKVTDMGFQPRCPELG